MSNNKDYRYDEGLSMNFLNLLGRQISDFSIGFVEVKENNEEDLILLGSGTLVDINGIQAVLTAGHVVDRLPTKRGKIGLIISEKVHNYALDAQTIRSILIGNGNDPKSGPDLGLVILPPGIGDLKARKSFFNIGIRREAILTKPPKNDSGVWCICGIPDIETKSEEPQNGFEQVKAFQQICGFGDIENEYTHGNYDYFDFDVHYNDRTDSPLNFGGVSGGGLWQVIIIKGPDGELKVKAVILSGVAFYQTELKEDKRIIKCHGRRSIYGNIFEKIKRII